jgi:hypothetical protein
VALFRVGSVFDLAVAFHGVGQSLEVALLELLFSFGKQSGEFAAELIQIELNAQPADARSVRLMRRVSGHACASWIAGRAGYKNPN